MTDFERKKVTPDTNYEKTKKYIYWPDEAYTSSEGSENAQPPLWVEVEGEEENPACKQKDTAA